MEHMSIKEAAARWGVSERLVQRLCAEGRIPGAAKLRGAWAIPAEAKKPKDPRKGERLPPPLPFPVSRGAMPLLNTPFIPGRCRDAAAQAADPGLREIARSEYCYFSGQAEEAADLAEKYLDHADLDLRLSACWIYGYANLSLGQTDRARSALHRVQATLAELDESTTPQQRALAVCVVTGVSVLLHLPVPEEAGQFKRCLPLLPTGLRLFALYVQAHQAYLERRYWESVGIAETALALEDVVYPIPTIYLHLVAAMSYMGVRDARSAREHLLEAWELARPDDLIEAFGEHHGLLGGLLEAVLKRDWPEDFRRIIAITYRFSAGWRKIHNLITGNDVADCLTTTEFAVAMLAARDWSNKEIGAHLGVSVNTVKHHISVALQKLGVSQRDELVRFMLK